MSPRSRIILFATIASMTLAGACGGDKESGEEHGAADHHNPTESGSGEHGAEVTGTETAGEHGAEVTGTGGHDSAGEHGIDTEPDDPVVAYCACMLTICHDVYHARWGEDHVMSEEGCLMDAEAVPINGAPIEMGNFLECRQHFCELGAMDESVCVNAIGDEVCV